MFRIKSFILTACLSGLFFFFVSAPVAARPGWINNPYAGFNRQAYVVAVGRGDSRRAAERDALRGIAGVFGLNVQAAENITFLYQEMVAGGVTAWTQQTDFRSAIETSVRRDNLIGADVRQHWSDGRGNHYVLAALNRATSVLLYSNRITANDDVISNLTNMPAAQRNSIEGFARYQAAAAVADMSFTYGEMLVFLGAPWHETIARGDYFRQRARQIARSIPIDINVKSGNASADARIRGAFADVLFDEFGFLTGGTGHRYALNVDITMQPRRRGGRPPIPGTDIYFSWIEVRTDVRANLVDTGTGVVLLPSDFTFTGPGRRNQYDAEDLALNEVAQIIRREYGNRLSRLAPRR